MITEKLDFHSNNGVCFLTFPSFTECGKVVHGISTRLGGVSKGYCSEMNFTTKTGDSEENVLRNYELFCNAIGADHKRCVVSKQTHTVNIRTVTEEDIGKGVVRPRDYDDVDGLVTDLHGITLVTHYADCVPLAFVDPIAEVVALSHGGWRGTAGNIAGLTIKKMKREFGCDPKNILCGIAPSICQDCFEVDYPVAKVFLELGGVTGVVRERGGGKYDVNLRETNRQLIINAGVPDENITVADVCTKCNPDIFHSHRATGGKRGVIGAFLGLKPNAKA